MAAITKLSEMSQISELVGHYAFLLSAGDAGESAFQEKKRPAALCAREKLTRWADDPPRARATPSLAPPSPVTVLDE